MSWSFLLVLLRNYRIKNYDIFDIANEIVDHIIFNLSKRYTTKI